MSVETFGIGDGTGPKKVSTPSLTTFPNAKILINTSVPAETGKSGKGGGYVPNS